MSSLKEKENTKLVQELEEGAVNLSGGQSQKLLLARALYKNAPILLLDEPLNGLDNEGVEEIRKVLLSLKEKGKLIILASHSKEDIQILCDTVFRMDHGKIIATETN